MYFLHPRRDYDRPREPDCDLTRPDYLFGAVPVGMAKYLPAAEPDQPTRWKWAWIAALVLLPVLAMALA